MATATVFLNPEMNEEQISMNIKPAKVDMPRLKKIVLFYATGDGSGKATGLSKDNAYWRNEQSIKSIRDAIDSVVAGDYKNVRVTPAQKKSLDNWVAKFDDKYLMTVGGSRT